MGKDIAENRMGKFFAHPTLGTSNIEVNHPPYFVRCHPPISGQALRVCSLPLRTETDAFRKYWVVKIYQNLVVRYRVYDTKENVALIFFSLWGYYGKKGENKWMH